MATIKDETVLELGVRFLRALKTHPPDLLHDSYFGDYVDYSPAQLGQNMTFNRDDLENLLSIIKYYLDSRTIYDRSDLLKLYKQRFQDDRDLKMKLELIEQWKKEQEGTKHA